MHGKRVLITGARGFIGGRLARALAATNEVRALVRNVDAAGARELLPLGVKLVQGDLGDVGSLQAAVRDVDFVYHLAEAKGFSRRAHWVNVAATRALIDAAQSTEVERFVYVSTIAVNGPEESDRCRPYRWYLHAVGKSEGERYGFKKHREQAFPFTVIRPAAVYARRSPLVDGIVHWARNHGRIGYPLLGDGSNTMHFGHVDDVARALELAAERKEALGHAYVIVDDRPTSWTAFLEVISAAFGVTVRARRIPVLPVMCLGSLLEWGSIIVGRPLPARLLVKLFSEDVAFSNRKAREQLGFVPRFKTPVEGLSHEEA